MEPAISPLLDQALPDSCRQIVLVLAKDTACSLANLWLLEKNGTSWQCAEGPLPVTLGRNGLAWATDPDSQPRDIPVKVEGDGRSPIGIFRISHTFGYAAAAPHIRVPYLPLTPSLIAVDDSNSRHYNQIVDASIVECDWTSTEVMRREDNLYSWGAVIAHNPSNIPGLGSCIFMHLWRGPGQPTAGCTAMAEEDLLRVLHWLDADAEPRWVQGLQAQEFEETFGVVGPSAGNFGGVM